MRPPRTAKDDQPGPTGRRHSAAGGDAVQSVLIRTPGMTSSRWGPRKPGQMGPVSASAGAGGSATGSLPDLATSRFSGVFAAAGTGGSAAGSLGPAGRRPSATGGDAVQSVLIRTPGMTSSRWGPRKPGQMGPVSASAGAGGSGDRSEENTSELQSP